MTFGVLGALGLRREFDEDRTYMIELSREGVGLSQDVIIGCMDII